MLHNKNFIIDSMRQKIKGFNSIPKKDAAMLKRQLSRFETNLSGIKNMMELLDVLSIQNYKLLFNSFLQQKLH